MCFIGKACKYIYIYIYKSKHCVVEYNQSQCLKAYVEFNTQKEIEAEKKKKNGDKDRKASYKLMKMLLIVSSGKLREQNRCKTYKQQKRL